MQELLTLVLEQLRNIWRFRWLALVIAWAIAIVGWLYVYSLPNQYEASARVHIDTKSAIHPLLSGMAVIPSVSRQVDLLIQTVLSRPHLRDIARSTGLDLNATTPEQEQTLVDGLHQRISLHSQGRKTDLYRITYTSESPKTARAVVQQVINIMTNMAAHDQENNNTGQATGFLKREVDKYKQTLSQTEHQLATFKKNHAELMPGNDDYVSRLKRFNSDIANLQNQLATARDRKAQLEQALRGQGGPRSVSPAESQQIQTIDAQISQHQKRLQQLLGKYTEKHPDVIATKHDIGRLEKKRADTMAELRAHPGRAIAPSSGSSGSAGISQQLRNVSIKIDTLQASLQRKQSQLQSLKAGADQMTDAQSQLAELSRNYNVTKDQYQKLLTRLYSARLSTDVQKSNDPLKFRVIDPPEEPANPSGPKRTILMTMALFAALAAGAAFAFFLSQIRPVFTNRRALTDATGLPVLGSVSMAWTAGQRAQRHTSLILFIVCVGTLALGYVGAVAFAPIGVQMVPSFISGMPL